MKKLMMAAMVAVAAFAATADDYSFTYQAELKDDKGKALESRNQTVEIRLWKTASTSESGDLLWGHTYSIYTDENGLFNQEVSDALGSRTSDDPGLKLSKIFCDYGAGTVYLGLKVKDSAGEIVPRQRLFAVPFAGRANSANNLIGTTHNVAGKLLLPENASLGSGGLVLPASSVSTMGALTAESVTCSGGDVKAANVSFTGQLTGADGKDILPVPVGGIIMWTNDTLPDNTHWAICDGRNSTPDLRDRFIVGAGSSYGLGNTGGEKTHKLTTDEMPSHTHSVWVPWRKVSHYSTEDREVADGRNSDTKPSDARTWKNAAMATGGDTAHENRPPYYALYYIMRIK